ncbi:MAG: Hsp70 family protein [Planctomycetota bacterium]
MTSTKSPIVGIDLGTTNSAVAMVVDGQPKILDCDGQPSMPSVVGLSPDKKLITGVVARNQLAAFPDRTIASIKRKMGTMEKVTLLDQAFTPPEISAIILRRLRDVATRALGVNVERAVITVPAYFDEGQRQATREAGELAGFKVERIINEPTAATLVYHAETKDRKHIAVYDFGGGTFDVSLVRMEDGVTEVLSSQGDTSLGGDDLDLALLDHVAEQFQQEHGLDLRQDPQSRFRTLQACEQAKIRLSELESTEIAEEFICEKDGQQLSLNIAIDRATFDKLVEPMIERTIECFGTALRDASLTMHQLDDLVLVGGSTRVPLVEEKLRQEFLREPSRAVDPDLAVALGAAVQAAMLDGEEVHRVLVDVSTHTLGIEVADEMTFAGPSLSFAPLIHRNTPLPARHEDAFAKLFDEQKAVEIHVLQGEHREPERNVSIGKFKLDVSSTDPDHKKITVGFDLTLDGILRVTAKHPGTGRVEEMTIENALTQFTPEQRDQAATRLNDLFDQSGELIRPDDLSPVTEFHDEAAAKTSFHAAEGLTGPVMDKLRERHEKTAKLLEKAEQLRDSFGNEDAEEFEALQAKIHKAVEAGDDSKVADLTTDLDDLLFYVQ